MGYVIDYFGLINVDEVKLYKYSCLRVNFFCVWRGVIFRGRGLIWVR